MWSVATLSLLNELHVLQMAQWEKWDCPTTLERRLGIPGARHEGQHLTYAAGCWVLL